MSDKPAAPLRGLKVLEMSREVPAAWCGRQFALWGADVAVLEPPEGSPLRTLQPLVRGTDDQEHSLTWAYVAANKRPAALPAGGLAALDDLLRAADVVILDHAPWGGSLADALAAMHAEYPQLCIVAFAAFGLSAENMKGSDIVVQALSGYLAPNGLPGQPPLRAPGRVLPYAVGVNGFIGALAGLIKRERTGAGSAIEVSALETLAGITPSLFSQYLGNNRVREGGVPPGLRMFRASDGWISMATAPDGSRCAELSQVLGFAEGDWPKNLPGDYLPKVEACRAFLAPYVTRHTADHIFHGLEQRGLGCGRVYRPGELAGNEQLAARGFFRVIHHPALGALPFAGAAGAMRRGCPVEPRMPNDRVSSGGIGWKSTARAARPHSNALPLAGIKIVDLTQAWIGPFATLLMADLGAEVVKIESHKRPDVWRQSSPLPVPVTDLSARSVNRSAYFNSVNRNKRSLSLDLTTAEGKSIFKTLADDADIVVENFTPRVMKRFGLDYDALIKTNPDLVMMSSSGFGTNGPWRDYKTNGAAIESLAGWDAMHCYENGEPVLMGFYQADAICGFQIAAMTLVALLQRLRFGHGDAIDASMFEAASGYVGEWIMLESPGGKAHGTEAHGAKAHRAKAHGGNRSPDVAPQGVFPCRGDDRWIAIAVTDDDTWRGLLSLPRVPSVLTAPEFSVAANRLQNQNAIEAALRSWTATWDADELMTALQTRGVSAGVVRRFSECFASPHFGLRDWFIPMTLPEIGTHLYYGFQWRFLGCELSAHTPAPRLGEHSNTLLAQLGYDEAAIAQLTARGVTGMIL